ncbi:MAG: hypothetical protein HGB06_01070 [Chlorobaculum sp.]|nr:hypothetical protein [Chlorobaculum sp.]
MSNPRAPYYPIIYVRGYAMSDAEKNQTAADPFCGFNDGSTVYRANIDKLKPARKFIFESPILRLINDYNYHEVYDNGMDIVDDGWAGSFKQSSIVIYRYYDQASELLGSGKCPPIEAFAKGLNTLIYKVRDLVCSHEENGVTEKEFRCYLVAHSMGGLICRAFLQNSRIGDREAVQCVDKMFTYATPHNGIEMAGLNVPQWLEKADMNNFNREKMADYLDLESEFKNTERVDWLPEEAFPSKRMFCMIGTNRDDYEVAMGVSRTFAGHGSDGLVRIENASVWGIDRSGQTSRPCATAYAYRSHSGFFGIVNSEEAYQNLTRFLFGDVRVDIWANIEQVYLPTTLEGKKKDVDALYLLEVLAAPKGKQWYLTRRVAEEDSVACISYKALTEATPENPKQIYLSTIFLSNKARTNVNDPSLTYALKLGIRVSEYELKHTFWPDGHFEGSYLVNDTLVVKMTPPQDGESAWEVSYNSLGGTMGNGSEKMSYEQIANHEIKLSVPFGRKAHPGIQGHLSFGISAWNR